MGNVGDLGFGGRIDGLADGSFQLLQSSFLFGLMIDLLDEGLLLLGQR